MLYSYKGAIQHKPDDQVGPIHGVHKGSNLLADVGV